MMTGALGGAMGAYSPLVSKKTGVGVVDCNTDPVAIGLSQVVWPLEALCQYGLPVGASLSEIRLHGT